MECPKNEITVPLPKNTPCRRARSGVAAVGTITSHQCGPGSNPGAEATCGLSLWVEFVVGSFFCSERLFSGTPGLPSHQKTPLPNTNSTKNGRRRNALWCFTSKSLFCFIYSIPKVVNLLPLLTARFDHALPFLALPYRPRYRTR